MHDPQANNIAISNKLKVFQSEDLYHCQRSIQWRLYYIHGTIYCVFVFYVYTLCIACILRKLTASNRKGFLHADTCMEVYLESQVMFKHWDMCVSYTRCHHTSKERHGLWEQQACLDPTHPHLPLCAKVIYCFDYIPPGSAIIWHGTYMLYVRRVYQQINNVKRVYRLQL